MNIQLVFGLSLLFLTAISPLATSQAATCFELKEGEPPVEKPLKERVAPFAEESGQLPEERHWAAVRGVVPQPIKALYESLLTHDTTKSDSVNELKLQTLEDKRYLERQIAEFIVKPFLFMTVKWKEDWVFALTKGTKDAPEMIVASFQKMDGTDHIKHLCGNIVLEKKTPESTDVYLYEEVRATRRSEKDTLNGLKGTLRTLADLKAKK